MFLFTTTHNTAEFYLYIFSIEHAIAAAVLFLKFHILSFEFAPNKLRKC